MATITIPTYSTVSDALWRVNDILTDLRFYSCRAAGEQAAQGEAYDPTIASSFRLASQAYARALREALRDLRVTIDLFNEHDEYGVELYYDRHEQAYDTYTGAGQPIWS